MNKESKNLFYIFVRYFIVIVFGIGNLYVFYRVFTPLTIWSLGTVLSIFGDPQVVGSIIVYNLNIIEIIPACVAGAAYYLLFVLSMGVKTDLKTRMKLLGAVLGSFFIFNLARLAILTFLIGTSSFEAVHWVSWHVISSLFVVVIWIFYSRLFKIKDIPLYRDFKYIFRLIKNLNRNKKYN